MDKYYLIEHDRHGKVPTRITEYGEFKDAEKRLCQLDIDQLDELNACLNAGKPVCMEYIVICAQSVESVKQTHARYFQSDYEVLTPTEIRYAASGKDREPTTVAAPVAAGA